MKEISKQQLLDLLVNLKSATPTTIITRVIPKMRKKNNPYYDEVTKFMEANIFINFSYRNSVNKALEKEGKDPDFQPSWRWGQRIPNTPLVEHEGGYYLECRFLKHVLTYFLHKNNLIDESEISEYLMGGNSNAEHQGVDYENEVIVRRFKIENILEIKLNKEHYIIKQS